MQQRNLDKLGNTDLIVSRVCLGTMTFGAQVDETAAAAMLDLCLDRGVNFIDTANAYNAGRSEEILGRILAGRRNRVILATKVGNKMGEGPDEKGLSPTAIRKGIEDSLRRLRTEYVDIYYLHQPDPHTQLEESLRSMDALVRSGKVRYVGISNYASWQACRMLWLAEANGWRAPCVAQQMYNVIARGVEQEFVPFCHESGMSLVAYNPLAGGLLTGKHVAEAPRPDTRFERMPAYRDRYWHAANFEAVQELQQHAAACGRTLPDLAFAWLIHHTATDGIVLGASRIEQLEQNLASLEKGPLPAEIVAGCDHVWKSLRGVVPQYNR